MSKLTKNGQKLTIFAAEGGGTGPRGLVRAQRRGPSGSHRGSEDRNTLSIPTPISPVRGGRNRGRRPDGPPKGRGVPTPRPRSRFRHSGWPEGSPAVSRTGIISIQIDQKLRPRGCRPKSSARSDRALQAADRGLEDGPTPAKNRKNLAKRVFANPTKRPVR